MEWYTVLLIIVGISVGLLLIYVFLRSRKIIGSIPILSNVIDPILNVPMMTMKADNQVPAVVRKDIFKTAEYIINQRLVEQGDDRYKAKITVNKKTTHITYEPETGEYLISGFSFHSEDKRGDQFDSPSGFGTVVTSTAQMKGNIRKGTATLQSFDEDEMYYWESKLNNKKVSKIKIVN
jgi:hypothetical protein